MKLFFFYFVFTFFATEALGIFERQFQRIAIYLIMFLWGKKWSVLIFRFVSFFATAEHELVSSVH